MSDSKTNEYLVALREDKTNALQQIFFAFHPAVYRKIILLVQDAAIADDLAQEVFIRLWEKRKSLEIHSNFRAYLMKMATNEALGYLRGKAKRIVPLEPEMDERSNGFGIEDQMIGNEMSIKIDEALKELPPRCQQIFLLSRKEGLTYQQIAEQMEISKKTVENQMGKALSILRKALLGILTLIGFQQFL